MPAAPPPRRPAGLSRRTFLRGAVAGGGALLAAPAFGGLRWASGATPSPPGTRPFPSVPEGTDMLPQIEHIVVVMMENHSFDNYLGMLGRGDGFTLDASGKPTAALPDGKGNLVHAFHMPTPCQLDGKPSQAWNAATCNGTAGATTASSSATADQWPWATGRA